MSIWVVWLNRHVILMKCLNNTIGFEGALRMAFRLSGGRYNIALIEGSVNVWVKSRNEFLKVSKEGSRLK